jgi:hypothetical protein
MCCFLSAELGEAGSRHKTLTKFTVRKCSISNDPAACQRLAACNFYIDRDCEKRNQIRRSKKEKPPWITASINRFQFLPFMPIF